MALEGEATSFYFEYNFPLWNCYSYLLGRPFSVTGRTVFFEGGMSCVCTQALLSTPIFSCYFLIVAVKPKSSSVEIAVLAQFWQPSIVTVFSSRETEKVSLSSSSALVIRSTHLWQWISGTSRIIIKTSCVIPVSIVFLSAGVMHLTLRRRNLRTWLRLPAWET